MVLSEAELEEKAKETGDLNMQLQEEKNAHSKCQESLFEQEEQFLKLIDSSEKVVKLLERYSDLMGARGVKRVESEEYLGLLK